MNRNQASQLLRISPRELTRWVADGCPCRRIKPPGGKGGAPRLDFAENELMAFAATKGHMPRTTGESVPPHAIRSGSASGDLAKPGLIGALARLRRIEEQAYEAFQASLGGSPAMIRAKERIYIDAHDALRKTEKDLPGVLEHRGEAIPLETVIDEAAKIDMAIRVELLGLPRKLALELSQINSPADVEKRLTAEIDDVLRHIAGKGTT